MFFFKSEKAGTFAKVRRKKKTAKTFPFFFFLSLQGLDFDGTQHIPLLVILVKKLGLSFLFQVQLFTFI